MSSTEALPPFPIIIDAEPVQAWRWPALPFDWRHVPPPELEGAQPCRIETASGSAVQGFMLGLDPAARTVSFRTTAVAPAIELPFARFRRLTLTSPLRSIDQVGRGRAERVPAAAQLREYRLHRAEGVESVRSCGHVENDVGLFLFKPGADDYSLVREMLPRGAYERIESGQSTRDSAAEKWIGTPAELVAAAERQRRMSIQPIGQSLLELGMVTPEQLQHALAERDEHTPLGERLVRSGVISKADLHTAIAHKMGYPFVDLKRFPIDREAARKVSLATAVANRALPILLDHDRLYVAVDRPSRTAQLSSIYALRAFTVVPVLSSKGEILLSLSALSNRDVWHENVSIEAGFSDTLS